MLGFVQTAGRHSQKRVETTPILGLVVWTCSPGKLGTFGAFTCTCAVFANHILYRM